VFLGMLEEAIEQMIDAINLEEPTEEEAFAEHMPHRTPFFTAQ
jgi:hypothetical protein